MFNESQTLELPEIKIEETNTREDHLVSIRDAARIIGVATHTLRYWEKEFAEFLIAPRTTGKQRRYGDHEIATLRRIHKMLKDEGYSIAGAKRALSKKEFPDTPTMGEPWKNSMLGNISAEMAERILNLVKHEFHYA